MQAINWCLSIGSGPFSHWATCSLLPLGCGVCWDIVLVDCSAEVKSWHKTGRYKPKLSKNSVSVLGWVFPVIKQFPSCYPLSEKAINHCRQLKSTNSPGAQWARNDLVQSSGWKLSSETHHAFLRWIANWKQQI